VDLNTRLQEVNAMYDAFFYEAFAEEQAAIERFRPAHLRFGYHPLTIQETGHAEPPAAVISIRTQSRLPENWSNALRAVLTRSTGYDHLVLWRKGAAASIPCGYLPLYCARAVAEQAALLWLALLRRLPEQVAHFSVFDRDGLTGREAAGRRLLVAGVGNIGYEVVRIGRGLDMRVQGFDLVQKHRDVEYVAPDAGLAEADVIVCAMSLNPASAGYFDYPRLRKARRGAVFVNIARGEISPSRDLLRLLDEGHLGGIGLDVYDDEAELAVALRQQKTNISPHVKALMAMRNHPRVIFTPHNAFNTEEAVERKARQSVEQVQHFLQHGVFRWPAPPEHSEPPT
jgi:D-lactate dehydrogenase